MLASVDLYYRKENRIIYGILRDNNYGGGIWTYRHSFIISWGVLMHWRTFNNASATGVNELFNLNRLNAWYNHPDHEYQFGLTANATRPINWLYVANSLHERVTINEKLHEWLDTTGRGDIDSGSYRVYHRAGRLF